MSIYASLDKAERLIAEDVVVNERLQEISNKVVDKIKKDSTLKKYVDVEYGVGNYPVPIIRSKSRDFRFFENNGYGNINKAGVKVSISSMEFSKDEIYSGEFDKFLKEIQDVKKAAVKVNDYMREFYEAMYSK